MEYVIESDMYSENNTVIYCNDYNAYGHVDKVIRTDGKIYILSDKRLLMCDATDKVIMPVYEINENNSHDFFYIFQITSNKVLIYYHDRENMKETYYVLNDDGSTGKIFEIDEESSGLKEYSILAVDEEYIYLFVFERLMEGKRNIGIVETLETYDLESMEPVNIIDVPKVLSGSYTEWFEEKLVLMDNYSSLITVINPQNGEYYEIPFPR